MGLYDMATRRTVIEGIVSLMVDHPINPVSDMAFMEDGRFSFEGLPPGPAVLVTHAQGFAPTYSRMTLGAGAREERRVGLLLEGVVSGGVVDSARQGVPAATIHVVYNAGFEGAEMLESFIGGHAFTGDEGRFIVNGIVPDEVFTIYAETEDGRRSGALTLEATPGIPIENVVLRMN